MWITCRQNEQGIQTWRSWFYEMICGQLKIWTHVSSHSSNGISFRHFPGQDHAALGWRDRGNLRTCITGGGKWSTDPADGNWATGNDSEACATLNQVFIFQIRCWYKLPKRPVQMHTHRGAVCKNWQQRKRTSVRGHVKSITESVQCWTRKTTDQVSQFWYRVRLLLSERRNLQGNIVPLWLKKKTHTHTPKRKSQMGELKLNMFVSGCPSTRTEGMHKGPHRGYHWQRN